MLKDRACIFLSCHSQRLKDKAEKLKLEDKKIVLSNKRSDSVYADCKGIIYKKLTYFSKVIDFS